MTERNIAIYAWRNLWRNRRRTLITLSSIGFGLMLAVLFTGLGDRTYTDMIDLAARMGGGHVTIQHLDYRDNPSIGNHIGAVDEILTLASKTPDVAIAVPRVVGHMMVSTAKESAGAHFVGIDPNLESPESLFALEALQGDRLFLPDDKQSIVLGKKLAERLDVEPGGKVVYTLTDKQGEMVTGLGRVSGIIETGADSIDAAFCLLPIDTLRQVVGFDESEASRVALFISDQRRADAVADTLQAALDAPTAAVPWHVAQSELAGFIGMKEAGAAFFEMVILLVIAAGIFNTLFVSVMERIREFGIMLAIGFSPGQISRLVMWESLWLALVGLAFGALLTAGPYAYLASEGVDFSSMVGEGGSEVAGVVLEPIMRVGIYPEHALSIAGAALVATLLAGLYPAWKAGRVVPVETIKLV